MSDESTAVVRQDENLTEQGKQEVNAIRQAGSLAVERQKAINATTRQLAGMTWGAGNQAVQGADLSGATRYAIAQLCEITGANPALHLYILGGRPYLNAQYWQERVAGQPAFVRSEQRNLSTRHIAELRSIAEQAAQDGDEQEAIRLRREARELAIARSHFSPPEWATEVIETIIYRYRENAPLGAIRTGQVDGDEWIETVRECNWAGGKPPAKRRDGGTYDADPVGNADPAKTARSRSFRRAAIGAFRSTLAPIEQELNRLESAIEAEFEVISSERMQERATLPAPEGEQAVRIGAGEPSAAAPVEAKPLPVKEEPKEKPLPANARKEKEKFEEGCKILGVADVAEFCQEILQRQPTSLTDYQLLNAALDRLADGEPATQEGLDL